jgi:hypothetical protein
MSKRPKREGEGRPTKYQKKYCKMLIEHMAEGLSFESFSAVIDVSRAVLYDWCKVHDEFLDAKRVGFDKNLLFWEKIGIRGATGQIQNFNASAYIFNKKNRHNWVDRKETDDDKNKIHTVKIELPGQRTQQVISMEPKKIEAKKDD